MSVLALLALTLVSQEPTLKPTEKPYLQLGQESGTGLEIVWRRPKGADAGVIEWAQGDGAWKAATTLPGYSWEIPGNPANDFHRVKIDPKPGTDFRYRLVIGGKTVAASTGHARPASGTRQKFVVFGDCGRGTASEAAVAYQASVLDPDYVVIPGDIVYDRGTLSEYDGKFFPYYNAHTADSAKGAPLMGRSTFVGVPGNHDIGSVDTAKNPDLWGYFLLWSQPKNGPFTQFGERGTPVLSGPTKDKLVAAAGDRAPVTANYSFDMGDAHWLVLDSNSYGDFKGEKLRNWIDQDLRSTTKKWKFVTFHHPPFHSSIKHEDDLQMRALHEIFLRNHVDVVWTGHVHNYQVSRPISSQRGEDFAFDPVWDGKSKTNTDGVIYVVEGAGGAPLYDPEFTDDQSKWKPFTLKYKATFSFGLVTLDGNTLTLVQRDTVGRVIDEWTLAK